MRAGRHPASLPFLALMLGASLCGPVHASPSKSPAAVGSEAIPSWLRPHVGTGEDQIAPVVLSRARSLYRRKVSEGAVRNPCYFAMDATRPSRMSDGTPGDRFYIVCEAQRSFRAISSGHGSGRKLPGLADFSNSAECARNFGNAQDSELTAGGDYVTSEAKTSFKGYYRSPGRGYEPFVRDFVQFEGEGETANARARAIGGHAAVVLKGMCLRKKPDSPYANADGYVPSGTLIDYAGGRSNGCTSWAAADAETIVSMLRSQPTSLYIYPQAADIEAVARAVATHKAPADAGSYWNATCLKKIGAPKFWRKEQLEPIIARYRSEHPAPPPRPIPLCTAE